MVHLLEPSSRILVSFVSPQHMLEAKQRFDIQEKYSVFVCVFGFGIDCNPMHMASQYITPCKPLPSSKWKAPQIKLPWA